MNRGWYSFYSEGGLDFQDGIESIDESPLE